MIQEPDVFGKIFRHIDIDTLSHEEQQNVELFMLRAYHISHSWHDPAHRHAIQVSIGQLRAFGGNLDLAIAAYQFAMNKSHKEMQAFVHAKASVLGRTVQEEMLACWREDPHGTPAPLEEIYHKGQAYRREKFKTFYVDRIINSVKSGNVLHSVI